MPDQLVEVTYYIEGVTEPVTDYINVHSMNEQQEINVLCISHARQRLPLTVNWRIVEQEELG